MLVCLSVCPVYLFQGIFGYSQKKASIFVHNNIYIFLHFCCELLQSLWKNNFSRHFSPHYSVTWEEKNANFAYALINYVKRREKNIYKRKSPSDDPCAYLPQGSHRLATQALAQLNQINSTHRGNEVVYLKQT